MFNQESPNFHHLTGTPTKWESWQAKQLGKRSVSAPNGLAEKARKTCPERSVGRATT